MKIKPGKYYFVCHDHCFLHLLFTLENIISRHFLGPGKLFFEDCRNVSDNSGATEKLCRPDYCLWVKGALLFKASVMEAFLLLQGLPVYSVFLQLEESLQGLGVVS